MGIIPKSLPMLIQIRWEGVGDDGMVMIFMMGSGSQHNPTYPSDYSHHLEFYLVSGWLSPKKKVIPWNKEWDNVKNN